MLRIIFSLFVVLNVVNSYRVFVFFPMPARSHSILGEGYVKTLLNDGQHVTYATAFPEGLSHENLTVVDMSEVLKHMPQGMLSFEKIINKEINLEKNTFQIMSRFMMSAARNENLMKFLRDPKVKFDVVIVEWMFSEAFAGLAPLFDAPLIWSSPMEPFWMSLQLIDTMPNPAYTLNVRSARHTPALTLVERIQELYSIFTDMYMQNKISSKTDLEIHENILRPIAKARGHNFPAFEEARFNASMMLGNTHISMGAPVTLPQNFKSIGGYHIDPDVKPLPKNLQKIMDNAKNGVIYMSMGSNIKSKDLPDSIKQDLLKMFSELQQTIIWKFEEELPGAPENVHIVKWAPQPSILNHSNCVLFISHAGLLSLTETVHYGVPIIGLPVFGDQPLNVEQAVSKGYAKRVDWSHDVAKDLMEAIGEMLSDPRYKESMRFTSSVYSNRLATPRQELAHWVRHVVETRGAPHLGSPALQLQLYQKLFLDVAALLLGLLVTLGAFCCFLMKKMLGKKKTVADKKTN